MSHERLQPRPTEHNVPTSAGTLRVHVWEPLARAAALTIVTVHPWAPLGGGEHNTRGVARALANAGIRALSFEMSSSSMVWGVLSNHGREVRQIVDVCAWAKEEWQSDVVLFGSSAGSPQAGSALSRSEHILGIACVGYTFGWLAGIAFSRHFGAFLSSPKPKLLITGDRDEFTSPQTLAKMVDRAQPGTLESIVVPGVGHFELEMPSYDGAVANWVLDWVEQRGWWPERDGAKSGGSCDR